MGEEEEEDEDEDKEKEEEEKEEEKEEREELQEAASPTTVSAVPVSPLSNSSCFQTPQNRKLHHREGLYRLLSPVDLLASTSLFLSFFLPVVIMISPDERMG